MKRSIWLKEREAGMRALQEQANELDDVSTRLAIIADMVEDALSIDGEHHKQWYLAQIGMLCGLKINMKEVGGIAP